MAQEENKKFRCGMAAIVGRPNVGKSTLLNYILKEKVAIVSLVPQTTRNQIRGIYNDERGQIVFLDTPGVHLEKDKLDRFMNRTSLDTLKSADCVIHLVDANKQTGDEEEMVVSRLKDVRSPIILGLNKIDQNGKCADQYISLWEKAKGKPVNELNSFVLLPLSAKTGFNIDKLLDIVFEYLPEGPALYPTDTLTDIPQKIAIADIVREKLFHMMREEVPHSLAVVVENMTRKRKNLTSIRIVILVERDSQKEIVIGKDGQVLKKVGTLARKELEELLETKVFLELHVKQKKNWRDDTELLNELGYGS